MHKINATKCNCITSGKRNAHDPRDIVIDTREEIKHTIDSHLPYGIRQQPVYQCVHCGGWYIKIGGR